MSFTTIVAMGPVLLAVYGILRVGIRIGVKRATKNVVGGFLMKHNCRKSRTKGESWLWGSQITILGTISFGPEFSLKERRKENRTREIGGTLWELTLSAVPIT